MAVSHYSYTLCGLRGAVRLFEHSAVTSIVYCPTDTIVLRCVMAAIRGYGSAFPCPVCLAPAEAYPALGGEYERRTPEGMKKIYNTAEQAKTASVREEDLKAAGLRRVWVCS